MEGEVVAADHVLVMAVQHEQRVVIMGPGRAHERPQLVETISHHEAQAPVERLGLGSVFDEVHHMGQ
ncbi:hypothetical protein D3C85_1798180 [compost metagenome]